MEDYRKKGQQAIFHFVKNKNNANKIEKELYNLSLKNLRSNENLETVYFLNILQISEIKPSNIPLILKEGKLNWNHDGIKNMVFEEEEQDNFIIKPFEIEEGVTTCKCGSKRVYTYSKQCRGGDEGSTTFATCFECKSQWTYS